MPKSVDEYVAENSRRLRDVDSRFIQVDSNRQRDLSFGSNFFNVDVGIEVYVRDTGDQILFGNPNESKGFGRGTFGDDLGSWSLETDTVASAEFTKNGRKAASEALNGQTGAVDEAAIGSDTTPATTGDESLGTELYRVGTFANRSSNQLDMTAVYPATSVSGVPGEYGVFDADGRLLARVTIDTSSVSLSPASEVRAIITVTFTGDGNGTAVVTNDGQDALAAALKTPKVTVGPSEFAFGSGSTAFSKSDSSLTSEIIRKNAGRDLGRDRIRAFTRLSDADMSGINNDLSEVGLFDNTGRMIWATTFDPIDSGSPGFNTETTIVVS